MNAGGGAAAIRDGARMVRDRPLCPQHEFPPNEKRVVWGTLIRLRRAGAQRAAPISGLLFLLDCHGRG
jgi:hypothetical protein